MDIHKAYNIPSNTGTGQTLALFELDGYEQSDIDTYAERFSLPNIPLKNILIGDASGSAGSGANEVTLDIELMMATAPGTKEILVYEGINDERGDACYL